jgi:zinc ribbon protein
MALCEECGTELPDAANYCSHCGVKLVTPTQPASSEPPRYEPGISEPQPYVPPTVEPPVDKPSPVDEPPLFTHNPYEPPTIEPPPAYEPPFGEEPPPAPEHPPTYEPPMMSVVPALAAEGLTSAPVEDVPWPEDPPTFEDPPPADRPPGIHVAPGPPVQPKPRPPAKTGARELTNWISRNKLVSAAVVVVVVVAVVAVANSNDLTTGGGAPTTSASATTRIAGEAVHGVGEATTLGGVQVSLTSATFQQSLNSFLTAGYFVATVGYVNTSPGPRTYGPAEWSILRPNGTVGGQTIAAEGQLDPGELPAGGSTGGKVSFEVGAERGAFTLIWKPVGSAARGVWRVTI